MAARFDGTATAVRYPLSLRDALPIFGRNDELLRTIQILCRRRKNNPIYVGEPGVGKTAIAEGLALKIQLRSEEHTSELQSQSKLVCRLLLEKKQERQVQLGQLGREDL